MSRKPKSAKKSTKKQPARKRSSFRPKPFGFQGTSDFPVHGIAFNCNGTTCDDTNPIVRAKHGDVVIFFNSSTDVTVKFPGDCPFDWSSGQKTFNASIIPQFERLTGYSNPGGDKSYHYDYDCSACHKSMRFPDVDDPQIIIEP
jgi:hypothetical protein